VSCELSGGRRAAGEERREVSGEMIEVVRAERWPAAVRRSKIAAGEERREASGEMIEIIDKTGCFGYKVRVLSLFTATESHADH